MPSSPASAAATARSMMQRAPTRTSSMTYPVRSDVLMRMETPLPTTGGNLSGAVDGHTNGREAQGHGVAGRERGVEPREADPAIGGQVLVDLGREADVGP